MRQAVKPVPQGIKWWYLIQMLVVNLVPIVSVIIRHKTGHMIFPILLNITILVISLLPLWENRWEHSKFGHGFNLFWHYVVTTVQMFLPIQFGIFIGVLHTWTHISTVWLTSISTIYLIVILVPLAYLVFGKIQSLIGRIAMSSLVIFAGMQAMSMALDQARELNYASFLKPWISGGILFAIMFVVFMLVTMHQWGYRGPYWGWASGMQVWPLLWMVIVIVAYSFWNGFGNADKLSNIFTKYSFHLAKPDLTMFLTGVEPGIAEEWLWRFVVLALLLVWVRSKHIGWTWMVWLDGFLFGFWHITNMAGQGKLATVNQMISAVSAGALFAAMYLYTKAIWVPMIFHTAVDSLSFISSGTTTMPNPDLVAWTITLIQIVVFAALTYYLISGKRKRTIEHNWQLQ